MLQELYKFVEGQYEFRYTSADVRVFDSVNAEWYEPLPISRNQIEGKSNLSKASLEVKVPLNSVLGKRWIQNIANSAVSLTLFEKDDIGINVIWKGRLLQPKANTLETTLRFESIYTSLQRPGVRRLYMRQCPYVLYGRGCRVSKGDFATLGIATSVAGETVVVPIAAGQDHGYYTGGILETVSGTGRAIRSHVGDTLVLTRELEELSEQFGKFGSQLVTIYPGCDRSIVTCDSKFSNLENFGGFPHIPTKSDKLGFM